MKSSEGRSKKEENSLKLGQSRDKASPAFFFVFPLSHSHPPKEKGDNDDDRKHNIDNDIGCGTEVDRAVAFRYSLGHLSDYTGTEQGIEKRHEKKSQLLKRGYG